MTTCLSLALPVQNRCEYRTVEWEKCTLIFGELPATVATRLFSGFPKQAVLDPDLARMTKSTFAIGLPEDTKRAREAIAEEVIAHTRNEYAGTGLSEAAIRWLAVGEHGTSSRFMFSVLTGIELCDGEARSCHPCDPDDLRRCRLLLESVPELQAWFPKIADVSVVWKGLISRWEELCSVMDAECPNWRVSGGKAAKTYDLMKSLGC